MPKVLFVNACVRGEASRTLRLSRVFLDAPSAACPRVEFIQQDRNIMGIRAVDMETLNCK